MSLKSCRTQAEVLQSSSKIWIYNWYSQSINTRHDLFQWNYSHVWENSFYFCLEMPGISPLKLLCSWDPLSPRHVPKGRPSAHRLHKLLSSLTHLSRAAKYMHQDVKSAEPSKHFCWNRRADNLWALQLCLLLSGWLVERKCTHNYLIPLKQRQMTAENSRVQQFEHWKILN